MTEIIKLEEIAAQVRRDIIRMVSFAESGHPGGSLGCANFMTALYFKIMKINPVFTLSAHHEDVFILSNGHISPVLYSVLARRGYFAIEELSTFRKINSRLQGHPTTHEGLPGVRTATGSLGQGLGVAVGFAVAKKIDNDSGYVFAMTGDGELQEGSIWEAVMFAPFHHLDNLIVTVDWNGQQIDGPTDKILSLGDLESKFTSFGWRVLQSDGTDMADIISKLNEAMTFKGLGLPTVILMKTIMGEGVSFMAGTHDWHGKAPNKEQTALALSELPETLGDYPYNENYKADTVNH
ncbi:MAG TPA: transketolase [Saprospiraceae bacterium]|nr:transketolase [Saprospiraceae bacterium]HQW55663.1 transketolase [Saprospiraceae bacterium]